MFFSSFSSSFFFLCKEQLQRKLPSRFINLWSPSYSISIFLLTSVLKELCTCLKEISTVRVASKHTGLIFTALAKFSGKTWVTIPSTVQPVYSTSVSTLTSDYPSHIHSSHHPAPPKYPASIPSSHPQPVYHAHIPMSQQQIPTYSYTTDIPATICYWLILYYLYSLNFK